MLIKILVEKNDILSAIIFIDLMCFYERVKIIFINSMLIDILVEIILIYW